MSDLLVSERQIMSRHDRQTLTLVRLRNCEAESGQCIMLIVRFEAAVELSCPSRYESSGITLVTLIAPFYEKNTRVPYSELVLRTVYRVVEWSSPLPRSSACRV